MHISHITNIDGRLFSYGEIIYIYNRIEKIDMNMDVYMRVRTKDLYSNKLPALLAVASSWLVS